LKLKEKGEEIMKKNRAINSVSTLCLIVAALLMTLMLFQSPAYGGKSGSGGGTACTTDSDLDGFCDSLETSGITFYGGGSFTGLNPATKDLFVYFGPITPLNSQSLLPDNPMDFVLNNNLGLSVHLVDTTKVNSSTRTVAITGSTEKAVKLTESLDTSGTDLGGTQVIGNINGVSPAGEATIYTQRIVNQVNQNCPQGTTCTDVEGSATGVSNVITKWIKHTIAHETGHVINLKQPCSQKDGGYHWPVQSNFTLDNGVYIRTSGSKTTFTIGSSYNPNGDPANVKLQ
jgi:hypothetical protein